jgi:hypothetical protein
MNIHRWNLVFLPEWNLKTPLVNVEDLVEFYESGMTLRSISARVGIPRETIRRKLHRVGVRMRHVHQTYADPRRVLDYDSAVLLGLHAGDGWISGTWGICLHASDFNMRAEVIRLIRDVLGVEPGVDRERDHAIIIRSAKKQVIKFFTRYGFPEGRKSSKVRVPRAVFDGGIEVKRGFLRGLFSSDGCFYREGQRGECRLEVVSRALRDGFVTIASVLGYQFRKYSYMHHGGHNKLPLHLAYLGKQDQVLRWMREIGSICDAHIRRFDGLVDALERRHRGNAFHATL